jgi:hypothetical protein
MRVGAELSGGGGGRKGESDRILQGLPPEEEAPGPDALADAPDE